MQPNLKEYVNLWLAAKDEERVAIACRRDAEDCLVKALEVAKDLDGTMTTLVRADQLTYTVRVQGRLNRKIDSDSLQVIAAEQGTQDALSSLFRWTPEINMTAWKAADDSITRPFLDAIVTTPGRPSFTITLKD